jgi:hypothetical protein
MGESNCGIYVISCSENSRVYVGSSSNLCRRKSLHLYQLSKNMHSNTHLQNAYNKYGEESLDWRILEYMAGDSDPEDVIGLEQYYIDLFSERLGWENMFNLSPIAGYGYRLTGADHHSSIAVEQVDPRTGGIVASFDTIVDAAEHTKTTWSGISRVCDGKQKSAGGWFWRPAGSDKNPPKRWGKSSGDQDKPVEQMDLETGKVINVFRSAKAAYQKTGTRRSSICAVCAGRYKSANGYFWRHVGSDVIPPDTWGIGSNNVARKPVAQVDLETGRVISKFYSITEASKSTGIGKTSISNTCRGVSNSGGGYFWYYLD